MQVFGKLFWLYHPNWVEDRKCLLLIEEEKLKLNFSASVADTLSVAVHPFEVQLYHVALLQ